MTTLGLGCACWSTKRKNLSTTADDGTLHFTFVRCCSFRAELPVSKDLPRVHFAWQGCEDFHLRNYWTSPRPLFWISAEWRSLCLSLLSFAWSMLPPCLVPVVPTLDLPVEACRPCEDIQRSGGIGPARGVGLLIAVAIDIPDHLHRISKGWIVSGGAL